MVFYLYGPIVGEIAPLPRHLDEYAKCTSAKNAASRRAALSLLCEIAERAGLPVDFPIVVSEQGKPFFSGADAPHFNLSHSGALAAAILGQTPVGIDIQEELDTLKADRLAARFFSENEQKLVHGAPRELFFELWTKKEALGKCLGIGLTPLLGKDTDAEAKKHGLRFTTERIFADGRAYTLTACAAETMKRILK